MTRLAAAGIWTGKRLLPDAALTLDEHGAVLSIEPARRGESIRPGLVLPGLINAHAHLELSGLRGLVPGHGQGFLEWGARMQTARPSAAPDLDQAIHEVQASGTALLVDISNRPEPIIEACQRNGLDVVIQHEIIGFDHGHIEERIQLIETIGQVEEGLIVRPAAHAPYSTAPQLIQAALHAQVGETPSTIHIAEDPAEVELLATGTGPLADLLDVLGRDWRWWTPPALSPIEYLHSLGCLGPQVLVVHGVQTTATDHQLLADTGCPLVLCPRSNRWIGGRLPPVTGLLTAGVPLLVGTDSLASNDDLDLLNEIQALQLAAPDVPFTEWLTAATSRAASALGRADRGELRPGSRPGILWVDVDPTTGHLGVDMDRQWLEAPA